MSTRRPKLTPAEIFLQDHGGTRDPKKKPVNIKITVSGGKQQRRRNPRQRTANATVATITKIDFSAAAIKFSDEGNEDNGGPSQFSPSIAFDHSETDSPRSCPLPEADLKQGDASVETLLLNRSNPIRQPSNAQASPPPDSHVFAGSKRKKKTVDPSRKRQRALSP